MSLSVYARLCLRASENRNSPRESFTVGKRKVVLCGRRRREVEKEVMSQKGWFRRRSIRVWLRPSFSPVYLMLSSISSQSPPPCSRHTCERERSLSQNRPSRSENSSILDIVAKYFVDGASVTKNLCKKRTGEQGNKYVNIPRHAFRANAVSFESRSVRPRHLNATQLNLTISRYSST